MPSACRKCVVPRCGCSSTNKLSFQILYSFPVHPRLRNAWLRLLRLEESAIKTNSRICSRHFEDNEFKMLSGIDMGLSERETRQLVAKHGRKWQTTPAGWKTNFLPFCTLPTIDIGISEEEIRRIVVDYMQLVIKESQSPSEQVVKDVVVFMEKDVRIETENIDDFFSPAEEEAGLTSTGLVITLGDTQPSTSDSSDQTSSIDQKKTDIGGVNSLLASIRKRNIDIGRQNWLSWLKLAQCELITDNQSVSPTLKSIASRQNGIGSTRSQLSAVKSNFPRISVSTSHDHRKVSTSVKSTAAGGAKKSDDPLAPDSEMDLDLLDSNNGIHRPTAQVDCCHACRLIKIDNLTDHVNKYHSSWSPCIFSYCSTWFESAADRAFHLRTEHPFDDVYRFPPAALNISMLNDAQKSTASRRVGNMKERSSIIAAKRSTTARNRSATARKSMKKCSSGQQSATRQFGTVTKSVPRNATGKKSMAERRAISATAIVSAKDSISIATDHGLVGDRSRDQLAHVTMEPMSTISARPTFHPSNSKDSNARVSQRFLFNQSIQAQKL